MINILLISVTTLWLMVHLSVRHRFVALDRQLPDVYRTVIAAPTDEGQRPQLIALAIDLLRKDHVSVPLDDLTAGERRMALFAFAVEKLPGWMVTYKALRLRPSERGLVAQLQQIKTSRPQKPERHFGAIHRQQQLRAVGKS